MSPSWSLPARGLLGRLPSLGAANSRFPFGSFVTRQLFYFRSEWIVVYLPIRLLKDALFFRILAAYVKLLSACMCWFWGTCFLLVWVNTKEGKRWVAC